MALGGVGGEEGTPSATEASPVGSLIFQPGPTPEINGSILDRSNLGRGKCLKHPCGSGSRGWLLLAWFGERRDGKRKFTATHFE